MIRIIKKSEPKSWTQYRLTPGVQYQSNDDLIESLLEEQGYICAYCMRRIPQRDKIDGKQLTEDHRIEHIKSQKQYPELQLTYSNMVICCPGHIGNEEHCDRLKADDSLSFTPFTPHSINTLSYDSCGRIKSNNPQYNDEIEKMLNLNTPLLVSNRRTTLQTVIEQLKGTNWTKAVINQYINKYSKKMLIDGKLKHIPYCGIVIYYLTRKLNKLP